MAPVIDNYSVKQFAERLDALRDFCFERKLGYEIEIFQTLVIASVSDRDKGKFFSGQGPNIPAALDNLISNMRKVGYV